MFYKKEVVNDAITCQLCSNAYTDPRILPCGETACNDCIEHLADTQNDFTCVFCQQKHSLPKEGFLVNRILLKLIKAKAEAVYRSPSVDELKEKLEEVKTKCDNFKYSCDDGIEGIIKFSTKIFLI
jgi:hypothetical protein